MTKPINPKPDSLRQRVSPQHYRFGLREGLKDRLEAIQLPRRFGRIHPIPLAPWAWLPASQNPCLNPNPDPDNTISEEEKIK